MQNDASSSYSCVCQFSLVSVFIIFSLFYLSFFSVVIRYLAICESADAVAVCFPNSDLSRLAARRHRPTTRPCSRRCAAGRREMK